MFGATASGCIDGGPSHHQQTLGSSPGHRDILLWAVRTAVS